MSFLFLFLPPLLATAKVFIQGIVSKKRLSTVRDALFFNTLMFISTAVIMAILFLRKMPSLPVFLFAIATGLLHVLFQCSYVIAFRLGHISSVTTLNNFNSLAPLLAGVMLYHESISLPQLVGLVLLSVAFFLIPYEKKTEKKRGMRWFLPACLAMLFGGASGVLSLVFTHTTFAGESASYVVISYFWASLFSLVILAFLKKEESSTFHPGKKDVLLLISIGCVLGLHQLCLISGLAYLPAGVLYPVTNVLTMIFIALVDVVFLHVKRSPVQWTGILLGMCAAVLISI